MGPCEAKESSSGPENLSLCSRIFISGVVYEHDLDWMGEWSGERQGFL